MDAVIKSNTDMFLAKIAEDQKVSDCCFSQDDFETRRDASRILFALSVCLITLSFFVFIYTAYIVLPFVSPNTFTTNNVTGDVIRIIPKLVN